MPSGLETTFQVLAATASHAAVPVLIDGLDSPRESIQRQSLAALLQRRSPVGGREILRRFDLFAERWRPLLEKNRARIARSVREALLGSDQVLFVAACRAAIWFRDYDMISVLLTVLDGSQGPTAPLAARCLSTLIETLYDELGGREVVEGRNPQRMRVQVIAALESSVKRFARHRCREVLEGFLLLANRDNAVLKQILYDPHDPAYGTTIEILTRSTRGGVIRLLLGYLDDTRAPISALAVIGRRTDPKFVGYLLRKIGRDPSPTMRQNLRRIDSIAWLRSGADYLDQFDEVAQHGAVRMVMASGLPRDDAFGVVRRLLVCGKPSGRQAAAEALAQFNGAEANALAVQALDDPDPLVQAAAVNQVRGRGIPGILTRLVELVDSPHAVVRQAVRENLDEFSFRRFQAAFDVLEDEVRQSTGALVRKVDPSAAAALADELASAVRSRRLRAVRMTRVLALHDRLAPALVAALEDEDHMIRAEAAAALADCRCDASREALQKALEDRSPTVREAAELSLRRRGCPVEFLELERSTDA